MGTKSLFVGNLPWSVTSEGLQAKFAECCEVSAARIVMDRLTNRSRGFGFVDIPEESVAEVIGKMNAYNWEGREISVNEAKPRVDSRRPA